MSRHGTIDVEQWYFNWLCDLIHADQIDRSYYILMKDLHKKEFTSIVEHDENRAYDGMELREECLKELGYPKYVTIDGPCSVLEMLIGLARRMDFETSDPYEEEGHDRTTYWFWEMIENLGLTIFDDDSYVDMEGQIFVDSIVDRLVERRYEENGEGGIFPLRHTTEDQRDVEIWYQMHMYLAENAE